MLSVVIHLPDPGTARFLIGKILKWNDVKVAVFQANHAPVLQPCVFAQRTIGQEAYSTVTKVSCVVDIEGNRRCAT